MPIYTVTIEASNTDGTIWRAMEPAETITDDTDDPDEIAQDVAHHQNLTHDEDGPSTEGWRVRVWRGADADTCTPPAAEYYPSKD